MSIRVNSTRQITTVTFLSDVDVQWISLVKRGANWTPFAMKSERTGGKMAGQVIHAILVPKGVSLAALKGQFGKDFDGVIEKLEGAEGEEITTDEFGTTVKYTQVAKSEFVEGSLQTVRVGPAESDEAAIFVVSGALKGGDAESGIDGEGWIGSTEKENDAGCVTTPREGVPHEAPFLQQFEERLQSFVDVTRGTLGLPDVAPKRRRRTIMNALNSFSGWLSCDLAKLGPEAVKSQNAASGRADNAEISQQTDRIVDAVLALADGMEELARKTEVVLSGVESIRVSARSELSHHMADMRRMAGTRHKENAAKDERQVSSLIRTLIDLRGRVDELAEKQETWEHLVLQRPSLQDDEPSGQDPRGGSPFSSMFIGRR